MNLACCNTCEVARGSNWSLWDKIKCCCCLGRKRPPPKPPKSKTHFTAASIQYNSVNGFVCVFPFSGPPVTSLVADPTADNFDMTVVNRNKELIVTNGHNLQLFGLDPAAAIGRRVDQLEWPAALSQFLMSVLSSTLQRGIFISVQAIYGNRTWHVHTHPIRNANHAHAIIIGCLLVAEPSPVGLSSWQMNEIEVEGYASYQLDEISHRAPSTSKD